MKKTYIISLIILAVALLSYFVYTNYFLNSDMLSIGKTDFTHDAVYTINGEKVTLVNGISETEIASESVSKIVTKYFGNEISHDFDADGIADTAFILTQDAGGSGTFYYVVARLNKINGPVGSAGVFLGDRIAPQNITIAKNNIIVVNYADRAKDEDFTVAPSVGKSIYLLLDPKTMQFGEVVQDFEGEADPSRMKLDMKTWDWVKTVYSDDKIVTPKALDKFKLTFKNDKTFSASTDCNGIGGEYVAKDMKITFEKMMSTLMYCEGSQEAEFSKMLTETGSYFFTSKGELVLNLKFDSGSVIFK